MTVVTPAVAEKANRAATMMYAATSLAVMVRDVVAAINPASLSRSTSALAALRSRGAALAETLLTPPPAGAVATDDDPFGLREHDLSGLAGVTSQLFEAQASLEMATRVASRSPELHQLSERLTELWNSVASLGEALKPSDQEPAA